MMNKEKLFLRLQNKSYGHSTPFHLFDAAKNSKEFVQKLQIQKKIPVHSGCVNSICWNENGNYLLSGSDDQHLSVVNGFDYSVLGYVRTGHRANIFSAKFLPNTSDRKVVSSSGDGIIIYSDLERSETSMDNRFDCHRGTAYEIMTIPQDPNTFLSCGEDKTVRWFDVRSKTSCNVEDCKEDVLINCADAVTSIAINPFIPYQLAVGCADSTVQIYDHRMLSTQTTAGSSNPAFRAVTTYFTVPDFTQNRRITSLCYSNDGQEMLVSYSSDFIYLFNMKNDTGRDCKTLSKCLPPRPLNGRPPMKRLRVRGDWSDTGPNSRPEVESGESEEASSSARVSRRMTNILTRILNSSSQRRNRSGSQSSSNAASEEGDIVAADSNVEEASGGGSRQNEVRQDADQPQPEQKSASLDKAGSSDTTGQITSDRTEVSSSAFEKDQTSVPDDQMPGPSGLQSKLQTVIPGFPTSLNLPKPKHDSSKKDFSAIADSIAKESGLIPINVTTDEIFNASMDQTMQPISSGSSFLDSDESHSSWTTDRSSEYETDSSVQSIQPNMSVTGESLVPSSPFQSVDDEEEVAVVMDIVDVWPENETQSQDFQTRPHSRWPSFDRLRGLAESADEEGEGKTERNEIPQNVTYPRIKKKYTGHRNARTMIKEATFWGDNFVMSGSDCGHIFIWDRESTEIVMIMEADHHVVNCLQPHPFDPILASSGIDYDIKLWAPLRETPFFDTEKANEIVKRNEVMLEVTKDTITVPASFMFRMLDTLHHIRSGRRQSYRWNRGRRTSNSDSSNR